jgi:hypothetical protein
MLDYNMILINMLQDAYQIRIPVIMKFFALLKTYTGE